MTEVDMIPIDRLKPLFIREISKQGLNDLVQSIRFTGILEPLVVRYREGVYELICGYRRFSAAIMAGLTKVPCIIVECDDANAFRLSLIENIQRENLSDYELAKRLKEFKDRTKYTDEQIAELCGKRDRSWVSRHLKMLELENLLPRGNKWIEKLTEKHARTILNQSIEIRKDLLEEVARIMVERGEPPSIREIERKAKEILKPPAEEEVLETAEPGAGEFVELKTPEDVDRFFDEILKASGTADVEKFTCVCGCSWTIEVDWKNRRVEWVAP